MKDNSSYVNGKDAKEAEKAHLFGFYHETLRPGKCLQLASNGTRDGSTSSTELEKKVPLATRSHQEIKTLLESLEDTPGVAVKRPVDI